MNSKKQATFEYNVRMLENDAALDEADLYLRAIQEVYALLRVELAGAHAEMTEALEVRSG